MAPQLTPSLRQEYLDLFDRCEIRGEKVAEVDRLAARLVQQRPRYLGLAREPGLSAIPWHFIAIVHLLESSGNFATHLHNGDPLAKRTTRVPAGRPKDPPRSGSSYGWEESAADALREKSLHLLRDWSLPAWLYQLERYNGFGYRLYHREVLSPYLWSFSNHYQRGKYTADRKFDATAVSQQCGGAVLLRRLLETGEVPIEQLSIVPEPPPEALPLVSYAASRPTDEAVLARARALQRWLNGFPGVFVLVDGWPGERTARAYRSVTNRELPGYPPPAAPAAPGTAA